MENIIYTNFFETNKLYLKLKQQGQVKNTPWRDTISQNSFCYNIGVNPSKSTEYQDKLKEKIKEIFNIKNILFDQKFYTAINGAGNEWKTFHHVHSSSLAAFLCFYSISESNPLILMINGYKCKFIQSEFEKDNDIPDSSAKSHPDVKLTGTCGNKTVVLYLEAKFSEYINNRGKRTGISNIPAYKDIYDNIRDNIQGIKISVIDGLYTIENDTDRTPAQYCEGVKQFISHYVGMQQCKDKKDLIFLGEIVFDFGFTNLSVDYLNNYKELHENLRNFLNHQNNHNSNFLLVDKILTYQEVFKDYKLDSLVKQLYRL